VKKFCGLSWLCLILLGGCTHSYQITLSNGNTLTTSSKPKVNKEGDAYIFKDANGVPASVPRSRVKEIAPL
jgi:hypothetical protein